MSNILSSILETRKKMLSKKRMVSKQLQENLATYLDTKLILNFSFLCLETIILTIIFVSRW